MKHFQEDTSKEERIAWLERYLFYAWLLNIADILVSKNKEKYKFQKRWLKNDTDDASFNYIINFFTKDKQSADLVHDLMLTLNLARSYSESFHEDELIKLYDEAYMMSKRHAVEHIRRLTRASIKENVENPGETLNSDFKKFSKNILNNLESRQFINSTISRCIKSVTDYNDFCKAFSWIGQMDYALGFFRRIIERAITETKGEIETPRSKKVTKLISDKDAKDQFGISDNTTDDFHLEMQASLLLDNLIMIIVEILNYLISREQPFDRARNLEFNEATTRLTTEKIDAILAIDGAYNFKRSIRQILQTVFLY